MTQKEKTEDSDDEAMLSRKLQRILAKKKKFVSKSYFKKEKKKEPICYECKQLGHFKIKCLKLKRKDQADKHEKKKEKVKKYKGYKKKAMAATWDNEEATSLDGSSSELEEQAMASRGSRSTQAREDEQRREERGEQQALAPHCPTVLPPPPQPVDYGVFMQGLVQAMQTQAQTQAALQAQLQAHAQALPPVLQEHGHGGPSIMERFKRMAPPPFEGESQLLLAES
ncbi:hypothetical protein Taro_004354 [Colocasia esculenta]|uniref:CCHC-type domain-containing protein n=1 Tax=Colocasia esculenta TaxID=4460 RepID=A0A843THX2_COLES|nr:hypothetical protein [Colocasia esculenta]